MQPAMLSGDSSTFLFRTTLLHVSRHCCAVLVGSLSVCTAVQALLAYCTAYEVFVWIYYATTRPHVWVYDNLDWGKTGSLAVYILLPFLALVCWCFW